MDWQQILFGFSGRIPRKVFWLGTIGVAVIGSMLSGVLMSVANHAGAGLFDPATEQFRPAGAYAVALCIISIAETWMSLALTVKRLHDRDRTGWWIVAQMAAVAAAILLVMITARMPDWQRGTGMAVSLVLTVVAVAISLWLLVQTGFLRGTEGPNRFGADPLAATTAEASL